MTAQALSRRIAVRGWAVAVAVYLVAVFHRTSLGVAGLQAEHRFGITPAQLSVFVLVQLGVYAAMQIPTGILVDRFGPRRLLLAAAATMALAQLAFAVAPSYPLALLARGVLGCGDALTFVSVLRFASHHFAPRHFPGIVAVTSMLGSAGNIAATSPLAHLLHGEGWTRTFLGAAALSALTGAAVWLALPHDGPAGALPRSLRGPLQRTGRRLREAWATPGTRVGFWVHFSCMSLTTTFAVLWGTPYLVAAGFSAGAASAVLMLTVVVAVTVSPLIGLAFTRAPAARVPFALTVCLATLLCWTLLLAGVGNHGYLIFVVALTAIGGPASTIGFALARDYNTRGIVGTATGVVNVGGFLATIVISLLVGALLSAVGASQSGYRIAFAAGAGVQLIGTLQAARWWLRLRSRVLAAQAHGEAIPVPVTRRRFDLADASV